MSFAGRFSKKPYLEQFERVKRWHETLNKIKVSNSPEKETDYQVDCIYAFYMNCYHLKDWLINSDAITNKEANDFIEKNLELKICRDLTNGAKHLKLNNPSLKERGFLGHDVTLQREYDYFQKILKYDNPIQNINYVILVGSEKYNVFELADKCMRLWEELLTEKSLK